MYLDVSVKKEKIQLHCHKHNIVKSIRAVKTKKHFLNRRALSD